MSRFHQKATALAWRGFVEKILRLLDHRDRMHGHVETGAWLSFLAGQVVTQ